MIVVTGMHRSGTSLVTNILYELGMDLGDLSEMYATDRWNAEGYFENVSVLMLNERIVLGDALYSERYRTSKPGERPWWSRLLMAAAKSRYLFLRSADGIHARAQQKRAEIESAASRFDSIVVKDPRFSLTLGDWKKFTRVDRVLYSYRHPLEVAQSIRRREKMPLWLGLRLWSFHVEGFLQSAQGTPVVFVDFNAFFDSERRWKEISRCFAFAGRPFNQSAAQTVFSNVLRSDSMHHSAPMGHLPARQQSLYAELCQYHACYALPRKFRRKAIVRDGTSIDSSPQT